MKEKDKFPLVMLIVFSNLVLYNLIRSADGSRLAWIGLILAIVGFVVYAYRFIASE